MYYPRSFLKFILLGFLLVTLPLVYALGELILSLDQLQTQGREAVQQAAQAGRASRQLFEQSVTLERIVRQYLILDDSALLDDYSRVRAFRKTNSYRRLVKNIHKSAARPPQEERPAGGAAREAQLPVCAMRRCAIPAQTNVPAASKAAVEARPRALSSPRVSDNIPVLSGPRA